MQEKRKPNAPYRYFEGDLVPDARIIEENVEMKLGQVAAASMLAMAGTLAACESHGTAQENDKTVRALESPRISQGKPVSQPASATDGQPSTSHVPNRFSTYAYAPIGDNFRCVAGAVTDEDGMNQRPYVYVASASGNDVKWARLIDIPEGFYESRATHCLHQGDALYVLLQSDTQSQQALSQTLLRVVKISSSSGVLEGSTDAAIPGVKSTYSAQVQKGDENFRGINDELLITGQYRLLDTDQFLPFHVSVKK